MKRIITLILVIVILSTAFSSMPAGTKVFADEEGPWLFDVIYANKQYVTVGCPGVIKTSPDGVKWNDRKADVLCSLFSVAWGNGKFVTVGSDDEKGGGAIVVSTNGTDWKKQAVKLDHMLQEVFWNGSTFIAVGDSGSILTSKDGINWSKQNSGTDYSLKGIAWNGKKFVVVGEQYNGGGIILTSSDGVEWNIEEKGTAPNLNSVCYGNGGFVAVSYDGQVMFSTNGEQWSKIPTGKSAGLEKVIWTGKWFVAVGASGTILASNDGSSWTTKYADFYGSIYSICWDGKKFILAGDLSTAVITLEGVDGNAVQDTGTKTPVPSSTKTPAPSATKEPEPVEDEGPNVLTPTGSIPVIPVNQTAADIAVEWTKVPFHATVAQPASDGGYIAADTGSKEFSMAKYDRDGKITWRKSFKIEVKNMDIMGSEVYARHVFEVKGGYLAVAETITRTYVVKTDLKGNLIWSYCPIMGPVRPSNDSYAVQTADNGYAILSMDFNSSNNLWLLKLNPSIDTEGRLGNYEVYSYGDQRFLDFKVYVKDNGASHGRELQQTRDGGYVTAGAIYDPDTNKKDAYVVKFDKAGNVSWKQRYGGAGDEEGYSIKQTRDGGYIFAGSTNSSGAGGADIYAVKLDANGKKQWEKTFGGSKDDVGNCVQQTSEGGYIITGYTESKGAGGKDIYVLKLDMNGKLQWEKTFGGKKNDWGATVRHTGDGGYLITGTALSEEVYGNKGSSIFIKLKYPSMDSLKIVVNGKQMNPEVKPVLVNKLPMVPVEATFREMGCKVSLDTKSKAVTLIKGSTKIVLNQGSNTAVVNDKKVTLEAATTVISGKMMAPVKTLVEKLGGKYTWDEKNKTVTIIIK